MNISHRQADGGGISLFLCFSHSSKERGCSRSHVEWLQVIPNTVLLTRNAKQPWIPITTPIRLPLRNLKLASRTIHNAPQRRTCFTLQRAWHNDLPLYTCSLKTNTHFTWVRSGDQQDFKLVWLRMTWETISVKLVRVDRPPWLSWWRSHGLTNYQQQAKKTVWPHF